MRVAILTAVAAGLLAACSSAGPVGNRAVPQPAKAVELKRYLGRWYEYARYENRFERGCEGVTAEYGLREGGGVTVINTCRKGAPDGPVKVARGKAKVVEGSRGAKLKVSFFGPFYGDYWVLDHADDYSWSVVGEPSGRYLWVLTREARPDAARAALLEQRVRKLGYDWALVRKTRQ
ncbi:MAG: lipocalin family protein [Ignavibacteriales bacterium]